MAKFLITNIYNNNDNKTEHFNSLVMFLCSDDNNFNKNINIVLKTIV